MFTRRYRGLAPTAKFHRPYGAPHHADTAIKSPQGHKWLSLMPLRGGGTNHPSATGALPPPKRLHPVGVAADLYCLTANYSNLTKLRRSIFS